MAYFNGTIHGLNNPLTGRYEPGEKCTRVLCDDCAEIELPLKPKGTVGRHWDTGFKWAPWYGAKCHRCNREA